MVAYTLLDFVNSGLRHIGEPALAALSETSKAGRLAQSQAQTCVEYIESLYPWTATVMRTTLSVPVDPDPLEDPEYPYVFLLPADYNTLLGFFDPYGNPDPSTIMEGQYVLSRNTPVRMRYSRTIIGTPIPGYLMELVSRYIGYAFQPSLSPSRTIRADMYQMYQQAYAAALTREAQQKGPRFYLRDQDDEWVRSRYGYRTLNEGV